MAVGGAGLKRDVLAGSRPRDVEEIQQAHTTLEGGVLPNSRGVLFFRYIHVSTSSCGGRDMRLQLARWGNSLAVRLPVECVRATGLRQGDSVDAEITPAGKITLTPAKTFDKTAFLQRLRKLRQGMPVSEPVVEGMRRSARY